MTSSITPSDISINIDGVQERDHIYAFNLISTWTDKSSSNRFVIANGMGVINVKSGIIALI